jgi:sucrose phosphorylase
MRLRNTSSAFDGELEIGDAEEHLLQLTWRHGSCSASLKADLRSHAFTVTEIDGAGETQKLSFG